MAEIQIDTVLGSGLAKILDAEDIQPGSDVGYELCKLQSGGAGGENQAGGIGCFRAYGDGRQGKARRGKGGEKRRGD